MMNSHQSLDSFDAEINTTRAHHWWISIFSIHSSSSTSTMYVLFYQADQRLTLLYSALRLPSDLHRVFGQLTTPHISIERQATSVFL